ncbi:MAG: hypothetical protein AB7U20_19690 [Planctomycetaceae bacterium]
MTRHVSVLLLSALTAAGLLISGCGGGSQEPESTAVIQPAAKEPSSAERPSPPAAQVAEANTSEPVADEPAAVDEPKAQAPKGDVAATPSEPEPETPVVAEPAPSESTAASDKTPSEPPAETAAETPVAEPSQPEGSAETVTAAYSPASVELGAEPGGTVFKGRVVVKGSAAEPKPIEPTKDAFCIALGTIQDESLVVSDDGGLANVIVWLRKVPAGAAVPPVPDEPTVLDNAKCTFKPHAFVLRVGQKMLVKNADPTAHNTRISPIRNNAFNQTIAPNERKGVEVVYQQPELVPIKTQCDIHPWMGSFHFPVEHPWAAVSDADGYFEITGLPAGELEFRLWHERMGYVEKSVKITVADGDVVEKSFEVDAVKLAE